MRSLLSYFDFKQKVVSFKIFPFFVTLAPLQGVPGDQEALQPPDHEVHVLHVQRPPAGPPLPQVPVPEAREERLRGKSLRGEGGGGPGCLQVSPFDQFEE